MKILTIRTKYAKYRTLQFTKEEFENADFFWTDDYYKVN